EWTGNTLLPVCHAVMQRKQLLGIRKRAERRSLGKRVSRGELGSSTGEPAGVQSTRGRDRSITRFIPEAEHVVCHETVVRAPADLVFEVASNVDMRAHPVARAIFWLREKILGAPPPPPRRAKGLVAETKS